MKNNIFAFIDAPDPDNLVMIIALYKLFPKSRINVVLTGRPIRFGADTTTKNWQWDMRSSIMAQQASAMRIKNFLKHFSVNHIDVFDGGIAPRTLVPHFVHFEEYYRFLDVDPLQAIRHSELLPQEELVKLMLSMDSYKVVIGGPMTGLYQTMVRNPDIAAKIEELHAMFATWGNVELMDFGDKPRGALQFNVACDPQAANFVLSGLDCPVYLMPTEVTRVSEIGFQNVQKLRESISSTSNGAEALYYLYLTWYDAAVKPRQEKNPNEMIFIHDVVSAISLKATLREQIYETVPIEIESIPYLPSEKDEWGKIIMKPTTGDTNFYAAKALKKGGAKKYLNTLKKIFK